MKNGIFYSLIILTCFTLYTPRALSAGIEYTPAVIQEPDLVVILPAVNDNTLEVGQTFTLSATVKNQGTASSASTTLIWYWSTDNVISNGDNEAGTDPVVALAVGATSPESITLSFNTEGTYYLGACVAGVSGEASTSNNCSPSVQVVVQPAPDMIFADGFEN